MGDLRWLVTGAAGMLGHDLVAILTTMGASVTAAHHTDLDITHKDAVNNAITGHDVVVNTAAWTDVDAAEHAAAAPAIVNGTGPAVLADACHRHGAVLIHISTDAVFDGTARIPYDEDAPTHPINAYGRSKLLGEHAVLAALPERVYVVRSAWLYGERGRNFVRTVLRLAAERDTIEVVDDQRGQPTWSYALAGGLVELGCRAVAGTAPPGVYHGTASGETTWFGLARAAFELAGLDPDRVRPTTSQRFGRPAPRPAYSVLGHQRWQAAGLPALPHWSAMLADAFQAHTFEDDL